MIFTDPLTLKNMASSISITAEKTLDQINEEFKAHFPHLRLKFYTEKHGTSEESSLWDTANMKLPLSKVGNFDHEDHLSLEEDQKVSSFESKFQDMYGLGVQVMYFKDGEWRQTRTSDDWTLGQQNTQSGKNSVNA
jgi:hypothetical protein